MIGKNEHTHTASNYYVKKERLENIFNEDISIL